jgi:hypothetical protein
LALVVVVEPLVQIQFLAALLPLVAVRVSAAQQAEQVVLVVVLMMWEQAEQAQQAKDSMVVKEFPSLA